MRLGYWRTWSASAKWERTCFLKFDDFFQRFLSTWFTKQHLSKYKPNTMKPIVPPRSGMGRDESASWKIILENMLLPNNNLWKSSEPVSFAWGLTMEAHYHGTVSSFSFWGGSSWWMKLHQIYLGLWPVLLKAYSVHRRFLGDFVEWCWMMVSFAWTVEPK